MSMLKPIMDIDKSGLEFAVNKYTPGDGLAWKDLFPLRYTPKFTLEGIEGNEGIPVTADRVAFNTKAPKKSRQKVGKWSGKLAKIAVSRDKDEMEINEYKDAMIVARQSSDAQTAGYLVDLVYNDVDFCNNAMNHRIELDAMRIGSHGVQDFPASIEGENATADTIDFNVPKQNFKGVKVSWSDADNADGLQDIKDSADAIRKKGIQAPKFAIMERAKFEQLIAQKATARRLFPRYDQTLVSADMITLESVNRYMSGKGWPTILVIDTFVSIEKKDGEIETIKPWDENVVTLSATKNLGYTYYKPVPDVENTDAVQTHSQFYKMTRYSDVNPMVETTMAEAYVQCGLTNRRSMVFINTEARTW